MKLFLTNDFNKAFLDDADLSCIIDSYNIIIDNTLQTVKNAYDNNELNTLTLEYLNSKRCYPRGSLKLMHEPTLEYSTESDYNFYTYRLRIDPSILPEFGITAKVRALGLVGKNTNNADALFGILYFNGEGTYVLNGEDANGLTISKDEVQEINLSLSMDEVKIEDETEVYLNDINDMIKNSHLLTPDVVRLSPTEPVKLKVTSDVYDHDDNAALYLTDNNFAFNVSGAPLIFSRCNMENKPFISLSNSNNTLFINNKKQRFLAYSPENKGESYSIFSNNTSTAAGSIDINSDNTVHVNDISNEYTDVVINSSGVSSTVTGYTNYKANLVINGIDDKIFGDKVIVLNASGIKGNDTDFALGNNVFINSNDLYYDNGSDTRSEMNFTTIGALNASSYNKAEYDWENSTNSVLMLGSNVSSVNINGDNDTFLGFSGLASNDKPDSYLIGSYNNPFDASLLTISTGWFDQSKTPKVFKLERDFVYATDEAWISRNNLMNIFDDKDIPYEYYEDDTLVTGMINDATCIQLGEDLFITTNEIVSNNRSFNIDDLIDLKNNNTDILAGQGLDQSKIDIINEALDSINAFIIHLHPSDFNGTSPQMSIDTLISKVEHENKVSLDPGTIYIIYTVMENDEGNNRWIIDTNNKKKYINNGDIVTCTQLQILDKVILN